jgi:hypothetical protein
VMGETRLILDYAWPSLRLTRARAIVPVLSGPKEKKRGFPIT